MDLELGMQLEARFARIERELQELQLRPVTDILALMESIRAEMSAMITAEAERVTAAANAAVEQIQEVVEEVTEEVEEEPVEEVEEVEVPKAPRENVKPVPDVLPTRNHPMNRKLFSRNDS